MASHDNAWESMYEVHENEEAEDTPMNTNLGSSNRSFLSARAPFATEDDTALTQTNASQSDANGITVSGQSSHPTNSRLAQRAHNTYGDEYMLMGSLNTTIPRSEQPPAKKCRVDSHDQAPKHDTTTDSLLFDNVERNNPASTGLDSIMAQTVNIPDTTMSVETSSASDSEVGSGFEINIQRCEGFMVGLHACLKACKENGRVDMVAIMAEKLEAVVDAMNRAPLQ